MLPSGGVDEAAAGEELAPRRISVCDNEARGDTPARPLFPAPASAPRRLVSGGEAAAITDPGRALDQLPQRDVLGEAGREQQTAEAMQCRRPPVRRVAY